MSVSSDKLSRAAEAHFSLARDGTAAIKTFFHVLNALHDGPVPKPPKKLAPPDRDAAARLIQTGAILYDLEGVGWAKFLLHAIAVREMCTPARTCAKKLLAEAAQEVARRPALADARRGLIELRRERVAFLDENGSAIEDLVEKALAADDPAAAASALREMPKGPRYVSKAERKRTELESRLRELQDPWMDDAEPTDGPLSVKRARITA